MTGPRLWLTTALIAWSAACSSGQSPDAGTPPDTDASDVSAVDAATTDATSDDVPPADVSAADATPADAGPRGACDNASDRAALLRTDYTVGDSGMLTYREVGALCGRQCFAGEACSRTCIDRETMSSASDACEECAVALITCAGARCAGYCLTDATSARCVACRCGDNGDMIDCQREYDSCSGVSTRAEICPP